jgi:hypothetical protein
VGSDGWGVLFSLQPKTKRPVMAWWKGMDDDLRTMSLRAGRHRGWRAFGQHLPGPHEER